MLEKILESSYNVRQTDKYQYLLSEGCYGCGKFNIECSGLSHLSMCHDPSLDFWEPLEYDDI